MSFGISISFFLSIFASGAKIHPEGIQKSSEPNVLMFMVKCFFLFLFQLVLGKLQLLKTNNQSQNTHGTFPNYLRVHQFNTLSSVQYSRWEPS